MRKPKYKKKKVPLEGPPENGSVDDIGCHQRWAAVATALGFNILAKDHAKTLGEKTYFRFFREEWVRRLIELGGNEGKSPFAEEDHILELRIPDVMPSFKFRASDIELMREVVVKHDAAQERKRKCHCPPGHVTWENSCSWCKGYPDE